eukprot:s3840_g2.t1
MRDPLRCSVAEESPEEAQTSNLVPTERGQRSDVVLHLLVDLVLFTATVLLIYGISSLPSSDVLWIVLSVLLVLMVLWRVLHLQSAKIAEIPYTCGYASANGKDVYIVSTLHISPRSERDVVAAISAVHPDVVMIELDEERLEFMRGPSQRPVLQQFQYTVENGTADSDAAVVPLVTQRAYWNGEFAGDHISGPIVLHSSGSPRFSPSVSGCIVLVEDPGVAPLAQLAFAAAKEQARALLCSAHTARAGLSGQQLPAGRLGNESLLTDLRVAIRARDMGGEHHMGPVVTQGDSWEVVNDPLSWLLLSWVVAGAGGFLLGVVCVNCCRCPSNNRPKESSRAPPWYAVEMDPTDAELNQIAVYQDALDWAGVEGDLAAALEGATGGVQRVREIPLIPRPMWDTMVGNLRLPDDPDPLTMGPPNVRQLRPVEFARLESLRRVCALRMGRTPDNPGAQGPQAPAAGAPPFPAAGGGGPDPAQPAATRKLKLSAILDPTLDAEVIPLSAAEQAAYYEEYKRRFGDFPETESDPSPDQLAALRQVLNSGAVSFACFTIFGPHGQRLLRRQTFTGYQLNVATGEWAKREQPGPSSYHAWHRCWRAYRAAMLLLDSVDAERLDNYAETVRGFVTQFGDESWFLIAKADAQMRSEQMERLRRQLRSSPEYGYTELSPWSAVFMAATKDHEYWTRELCTPATLFLARHKKERPREDEEPSAAAGSPTKRQKKTSRPSRRGYVGDDHSEKDAEGLYVKNRRGVEICKNFNANKCGNSSAAQSKCKAKRSHQCNKCLGPHQAIACPGPKVGGAN